MAFIRSFIVPYFFLRIALGQDATTSLSSESEQLFFTQGILDPEPVPESTPGTTSSSTSERIFRTQGLPDVDLDPDLIATVTLASRTSASLLPTTSTPDPSNPSSCNTTVPTCPSCDTESYTSPSNTTYTIACAAKLYSSDPYPVQRWLGPLGCVAECDKYTWCKGATSWEEGNCQLARGENVFPQYPNDDGEGEYVAFLRVPEGYVPEPPATVPSAFPTGPVPLPPPISSPLSQPTGVNRPRKCDLRNVTCPSSTGQNITSASNATYSVRCKFEPRCEDFRRVAGQQSRCSCLARCDRDKACVAALFDRGECNLCYGALDGLSTYTSPRNYTLFVSEGLESISSTSLRGGARLTLSPSSLPWMTERTNIPTNSRHSSSSTTSTSSRQTSSASDSLPSTADPANTTSPRRSTTTQSTSSTPHTTTRPRSPSSRSSTTTSTTGSLTSSSLSSPCSTSSASQQPPPSNLPFSPPTAPNAPQSTISPTLTSTPSTFQTIPTPLPPLPHLDNNNNNPARLPPLSAATCPADDDEFVFEAENARTYVLQCGVRFDALTTQVLPVAPFALCAEQCEGECGGVMFNAANSAVEEVNGRAFGGPCTLYTAISAIQPQVGATAGVWVRFPGTGMSGSITRMSATSSVGAAITMRLGT